MLLAELSHRADRWGNLNGEIHQYTTTRIVFFPIKNDSLSHLTLTLEDMNSFERCDSPFQLAHNTSPKRILFRATFGFVPPPKQSKRLQTSHFGSCMPSPPRACPEEAKLGSFSTDRGKDWGSRGCKKCQAFQGVSHTHVSVNLSVNLFAD